MRSQYNTESDEEYLDDPIKLFDSELERVNFGSQLGNTASNYFYEPGEHKQSDNDLSEELYSDSESSQERECLPSYIKLVDCAKFPWYYKRYTQQIIEKTSDICDLVSDSDTDFSGEHLTEDKNDCIIVEEEKSKDDIVNKPNETSSKECGTDACTLFLCKNLEERRLERMKRREDFELQRALSQKCTVNVDFKRNKGLIGMTIKQKFVRDIGSESATPQVNKTKISRVKEKKKPCVNKSYIKAADKALSSVGTELLAVPEVAENNKNATNYTSEDGHKRHEANGLGENFPVKFSLGKISEKLLQHIKAKRCNNKCQTTKHQDDKLDTVYNKPKSGPNLAKPLKLSSFANKVSSSNVKNIEKTNKFKNNQVKAIESMLLHLLTNPNKKEVGIDSKKAEVVMNIDQNPPKNTDNRCEPNSPILPCTLAKKIKKANDSIKALENMVSEAAKMPVASNMDAKCVTKSPKKCNINVISTMTSSRVNSKKDKKPKNTGQPSKLEAHQETTINGNIASKSNVSISDIQIFTSIPTSITPITQTYVSLGRNNISTSNTAPSCSSSQTNIASQVPNSKCNNVIPIVSNNCVVTSNQVVNAGPAISNKIIPSSTNVIHSQCNPVTVANNNHITVFTKDPKSLPGRTGPGNELNHNNTKNHSYNSCSSAFILRPPRPNEFFSRVRPIHPGQYGPEIQKRPQMQPRFYNNPYRGNYIPPNMRKKRFNPRLPNCTHANYRFPAPPPSPANSCKSLHDPSHYQSNRTWHKPNMYPEWDSRSEYPLNPPPCGLSIPVLQRPLTTVSSKLGYISQPMDTEQEKNRGQQDRCLKNLDSHDWRNKKVLDPRLITQDSKEVTKDKTGSEASSDLVTTKTKMLELLDSATNALKRCVNEDDNINEGILVDTFKLPKISKLETVTEDFYSKQVDQRIGYSPPILPIPTFEKVLDQAKIETQQQDKQIDINIIPTKNIYNEIKNRNILSKKTVNAKAHESTGKGKEKTKNKNPERKFMNDCNKRPISVKSQKCGRKEEIKKISLEEYKKRTHLMAHQSRDSDKVQHRDKSNINKQRWVLPNIPKSNADRFSTESDLGYDSDSTVIL